MSQRRAAIDGRACQTLIDVISSQLSDRRLMVPESPPRRPGAIRMSSGARSSCCGAPATCSGTTPVPGHSRRYGMRERLLRLDGRDAVTPYSGTGMVSGSSWVGRVPGVSRRSFRHGEQGQSGCPGSVRSHQVDVPGGRAAWSMGPYPLSPLLPSHYPAGPSRRARSAHPRPLPPERLPRCGIGPRERA